MKIKKSKRESKNSKKTKEIAYKIGEFFYWNYDEKFIETCKKLSKKHRLNFYLVLYTARQRKYGKPRFTNETDFDGLARLTSFSAITKLDKTIPNESTIDRFLKSLKSIK